MHVRVYPLDVSAVCTNLAVAGTIAGQLGHVHVRVGGRSSSAETEQMTYDKFLE